MKKWLCLLSILMITICGNVYAIEPGEDAYDNSDGILVASTTKYYKTVTNTSFGDSDIPSTLATPASVNANSITYEITEEEYNAADGSNNNLIRGTVETEYKKMQSFIYANDTIYRYKVTLSKMFPKSLLTYLLPRSLIYSSSVLVLICFTLKSSSKAAP